MNSFTPIKISPNSSVKVNGKIDGGPKVDPAWGGDSNVACYIHYDRFNGAHKVYAIDIPEKSTLTLTATPSDPKLDLSLYAYQAAPGVTEDLPPKVYRTSCEASSGTWTEPYNPGGSESVEVVSTTNPYRIFVGVVGAKGAMTGGFSLRADLKTAAPPPSGKVKSATPIAVKLNATSKTSGKLDGGPKIDLAWGASSQVACFVDYEYYNGAHKLFKLAMPANSKATITVTPSDPTLDVSVYGYLQGALGEQLPPDVTHAAMCEASGGSWSAPSDPGKSETIDLNTDNPLTAYIGVAGAHGTMSGRFTVSVNLRPQ